MSHAPFTTLSGKSLISNNKINPTFNNSIAIRGNIPRENLNNLNKKNISLYLGHGFHFVLYPLNNKNEDFNFIGILKYKLTANELNNYELCAKWIGIRNL